MTGPAFPALPQPAPMRSTDGVGTGLGSEEWEEQNDGGINSMDVQSAGKPEPVETKASTEQSETDAAKTDVAKSAVSLGPEAPPTDRASVETNDSGSCQQEKKPSRAPRPPTKPATKEGGTRGTIRGNSDRAAVKGRKLAKMKKMTAVPTVDVNVEMDSTSRFTRSNQVLGKGSSKVVYKGFDQQLGMEIAWNQVKIPANLSPRAVARLMNEIDVLKGLKHKNIMKFYSSWIDTERHHLNFITEYFNPGPLRRHRCAHKCMPRNVLKRWAWQILQGLVYLHGHHPPIIHRDLKCDNIFIHGVTGEVKIGDLGLAKLMEEGLSTCQSVLGTPEFMAPELYHGIYNEKVDIYAYGMCLLELVTMQFPYMECQNSAQIFRHVSMGIHPTSLSNIEDHETREFIELCINHFHERRPYARQLVKHPFFNDIRDGMQPPGPLQKHMTMKFSAASKPPRIQKVKPKITFTIQRKEVVPHSSKIMIELSMVMAGSTKLFMFQFNVDTDTVDAVAMELQEEFGLTNEEKAQFTELLAGEIGDQLAEERRDTIRDIKASLAALEDVMNGVSDDDDGIGAGKNIEEMSESNEEDEKETAEWPSVGDERSFDEGHTIPDKGHAVTESFATDSVISSARLDTYADDSAEEESVSDCSPRDGSPYSKCNSSFVQGVEQRKEKFLDDSPHYADMYRTANSMGMAVGGGYPDQGMAPYVKEPPQRIQSMDRTMDDTPPALFSPQKQFNQMEQARQIPEERHPSCATCSSLVDTFWASAKEGWSTLWAWGSGQWNATNATSSETGTERPRGVPNPANNSSNPEKRKIFNSASFKSRFQKTGSFITKIPKVMKERPVRR